MAGRKPIGKRAMTDAERQRRRRKRLRSEKRAAEIEAKREKNRRAYREDMARRAALPDIPEEEMVRHTQQELGALLSAFRTQPAPASFLTQPQDTPADRLAVQIAHALQEGDCTVDELRQSLDRLFGPGHKA